MTKALALMLAALTVSAALAQQPAPAQRSARSGGPNGGYDPNEIVCRTQDENGSRLRRHRVCVTRAQWAEQRRLDRQNTEKAQTNRRY
jgi:invasion protein IalB